MVLLWVGALFFVVVGFLCVVGFGGFCLQGRSSLATFKNDPSGQRAAGPVFLVGAEPQSPRGPGLKASGFYRAGTTALSCLQPNTPKSPALKSVTISYSLPSHFFSTTYQFPFFIVHIHPNS